MFTLLITYQPLYKLAPAFIGVGPFLTLSIDLAFNSYYRLRSGKL